MDTKEIVENSTPLGVKKIIVGRFIKEYSPTALFIAGKGIVVRVH